MQNSADIKAICLSDCLCNSKPINNSLANVISQRNRRDPTLRDFKNSNTIPKNFLESNKKAFFTP